MKEHNFKITLFAKSEEEAKAQLKEFAIKNPFVTGLEPITKEDEKRKKRIPF